MRTSIIVLSAVLAIAATGCSTAHPRSPASLSVATAATLGAVQHVTIHATNQLRFSPDTVHVHPGSVEITLTDDGSYPHNLSLPGQKITSQPVTGNLGEQSTTFRVTFTTPGTYRFLCTYHVQAGMHGEIVVDPR